MNKKNVIASKYERSWLYGFFCTVEAARILRRRFHVAKHVKKIFRLKCWKFVMMMQPTRFLTKHNEQLIWPSWWSLPIKINLNEQQRFSSQNSCWRNDICVVLQSKKIEFLSSAALYCKRRKNKSSKQIVKLFQENVTIWDIVWAFLFKEKQKIYFKIHIRRSIKTNIICLVSLTPSFWFDWAFVTKFKSKYKNVKKELVVLYWYY